MQPSCLFGISGAYSVGSRALYYSCIVGTLLVAAWRCRHKNANKERTDIALVFLLSTTAIIFLMALIHLFVMGLIGYTTKYYHYVIDLDSFVATKFVFMGITTLYALAPIWPYNITGRQAIFANILCVSFLPLYWIGVSGGQRPLAPEYSPRLAINAYKNMCPTFTAPMRKHQTPFWYPDGFSNGSLWILLVSQLYSLVMFEMELCCGQWRFYRSTARPYLWAVMGILWIIALVSIENHLRAAPFSTQAEPLSSIGQWGAIVNALLCLFGPILIVSLGPNHRSQICTIKTASTLLHSDRVALTQTDTGDDASSLALLRHAKDATPKRVDTVDISESFMASPVAGSESYRLVNGDQETVAEQQSEQIPYDAGLRPRIDLSAIVSIWKRYRGRQQQGSSGEGDGDDHVPLAETSPRSHRHTLSSASTITACEDDDVEAKAGLRKT